MKRTSFASAEYAAKKRQTRRERFLSEMSLVVPWARLEALIEPHYPKSGKVGRPLIGVSRMLRMYFPRSGYNPAVVVNLCSPPLPGGAAKRPNA